MGTIGEFANGRGGILWWLDDAKKFDPGSNLGLTNFYLKDFTVVGDLGETEEKALESHVKECGKWEKLVRQIYPGSFSSFSCGSVTPTKNTYSNKPYYVSKEVVTLRIPKEVQVDVATDSNRITGENKGNIRDSYLSWASECRSWMYEQANVKREKFVGATCGAATYDTSYANWYSGNAKTYTKK